MPTRLGVMVVGIALLALTVFLLGRADSSAAQTRPAAATQPEAPAATVEAAPTAPAGSATPAREARPPTEAVAPARAPDDEKVLLRGTFVVTDPDGVEHAHEDGSFGLMLWHPSIEQVTVHVEDGHWRAEVSRPRRISVRAPILGGRAVQFDERTVIDVPAGPLTDWSATLAGRWVAMVSLAVVDRETSAHLSGVRIVAVDDWRRDLAHPGEPQEHRIVVEHGTSPLRFAPERAGQRRKYWVGAPGYAWATAYLSIVREEHHEIRLAPGGALKIHLQGGAAPEGARIRVRRSSENQSRAEHEADIPIAEATVRFGRPVLIDGLLPGPCTVGVEHGPRNQTPAVLGVASAAVVVGETTPISVALDQAEEPPRVPVAGVIELPKGWSRSSVQLGLVPLGSLTAWLPRYIPIHEWMMEAFDAGFHWDAGTLPRGRYRAQVHPTGISTEFETGRHGNRDIHLAIPPLARVRVRFLDPETGAHVTPSDASWGVGGSPRIAGQVRPNADTGEFELKAPAGDIYVSVFGNDRYQIERAPLVVVPGDQLVEVTLQRAIGVEVTFTERGTVVRQAGTWHIDLEPTQGQGRANMWRGSRVWVTAPGPYRLRVVDPRGGVIAAPRTVNVAAAGWTPVRIELAQ
ncbi:MAG: hypothetical protein AAF628_32190 [Planctomycetota bacterium]